MKGEINRDCYCSAHNSWDICETYDYEEDGCGGCACLLHKYPTPEQFKKEYGEDVPDGMLVWVSRNYPCGTWTKWAYDKWTLGERYDKSRVRVVCACTPWGKPPDDWRPA